jgi:hypothetical protein
MSVRVKLIVAMLLSIALFAGASTASLFYRIHSDSTERLRQEEARLLAQKRAYLQDVAGLACSLAKSQAQQGGDTETLKRLLSALRYENGSGYFFAYEPTSDGYQFAFHGSNPKLNGQLVKLDEPDAKGFAFRRVLVDAAKKPEGGFVEYYYEKPTTKEVVKKLAYARQPEGSDWVLVGGIYIDDVEKTLAGLRADTLREARNLFVFMSAAALLVLVVAVVLAVRVASSVTRILTEITDRLSGSSHELSRAAEQSADASHRMAEGAGQQAAALQETAAAVEEITAMTAKGAKNSQEADERAAQARAAAESGHAVVAQMSDTIQRIKSCADQTARIIKTINEIAFQTNLLALNAAVEAARAGDAGKGFAVVAQEVRNLAQRSAAAVQDTTQLIEQSRAAAGEGVQVAADATGVLEAIGGHVGSVTTLIGAVAQATQEQSQGLSQISTAVARIDGLTQQTAASANGTAESSKHLNEQASALDELTAQLRAVVQGRRAARVE